MDNSDLCRQVEEDLAQILDGTAPARLMDHLADCDDCRDLRHEAMAAGEALGKAGADFRPADDFLDRLVAKLEAARPDGPAVASAPREISQSTERPNVVVRSSPPLDPSLETAATVFDPVATARAEGATVIDPIKSTRTEAATVFDPVASARAEAEADGAPEPEAAEVAAPIAGKTAVGKTLKSDGPSSPALGVSATTHHGPITAPEPASPTIKDDAIPADAAPIAEAPAAQRPLAKPAPRGKVALFRRPSFMVGVAGVLAAAAAVGVYVRTKGHTDAVTAQAPAPWWGNVASVSRASADKTGGLEACDSTGACAAVDKDTKIKKGSTIRTDARTRAYVTLADGTELALDRGSELELSATENRSARVKRGTIVADVAHVEGSNAHFAFAAGDVEVVGTKLAISAGDDRASVEVARGTVRLRRDGGKWVEVRAGEEATLLQGQEPVVAGTSSLADVMEWSDKKPEEVDSPVLRGIGELRARKPGQTNEKDHAVRLAKHSVKVRVVDVVARTEVDETFANDTDEELEGIFRFPLPPGAQIEKLALEVDGKMVDGAFVDRDKGAAIWRGVIQNAAPKAPKPKEEIIWVPGPWRDPALLEWQRGGRFELKIFPIPKKGSRRVVLTYTQTVEQAAGIRRFTYPLAHDPSGTTKIGSFDMDVQVLGADKAVPIAARGYDLVNASGDGDRRTMHADNFIPAGDLTVEYALPDRDKEATAWAYSMTPIDGAATPTVASSAAPGKSAAPKTPEEKAAAETAQAILNDTSPYVAIAVRPKLPRWQEAKERLHVIVVDSSRSMFGERFARATHLASSIVREMDRRDSFVLLACDTICRPMTSDGGSTPKPEVPGASASESVERFLGGVEPDGGSDLAAAMSAARAAAGATAGKELRIIYLGDGTPSVGPTRPAHLEAAVRSAVPTGDGAVVAVALGADADTTSLQALARGGGGVVVPYVPGQKVSSAALDVLSAAYGVVLRDPEVELPAGLSQVTPSRLDPIRAGGETLIVARMSGGNEVSGSMKLKGRVAGERFEQTYPIKVISTSNAGNAFVPRLYAAAKIAELERIGSDAQKPTVIELSKRFSVASRFTSLLVLESEAMFKAFGLDRSSASPTFTGELAAKSSSADADGEQPDEAAGSDDAFGPAAAASASPKAAGAATRGKGGLETENPFGDDVAADKKADSSGFGSGHGRLAGGSAGPMPMGGAGQAPSMAEAPAPTTVPPAAPPAQAPRPSDPFMDEGAAPAKKPAKVASDAPFEGARRWRPPPPPRTLVPMRRVFDRKVAFDAVNTFVSQNASRLTVAESTLAAAPDSRDKTVDLYSLYATSGRLNEAQELTAKWAGRDALDPDALLARADLAARQGDRDRAIRILGGLADVRPNDRAIQTRLVDLQTAAGNAALACEHRLALADMASTDAKLVADAVRCARSQGQPDLASLLKLDAGDKVREVVDKLLLQPDPVAQPVRGDVQITAEWTSSADLDVAVIDPQGKRISWLGSPTKSIATVRDATSLHDETLGIVNLPQGNYVIEISRAAGRDTGDTVRGEVTLRLGGDVRKLPFTLTGARAEVGTVRVFFTSHLERADGVQDFGGGWRGRF